MSRSDSFFIKFAFMHRIIDILLVNMLLLLSVASGKAAAQDTERPLPPLLEYISVNPATGHCTLTWMPGGSPDVAGYVFYIYRDGAGEAFDTIYSPLATSYTDIKSNASLFSVTYLVAAIDSSGNISPLSNRLRTIFTEVEVDTCNQRIRIGWNSYIEDIFSIDYYNVTYSVDGAEYLSAGTTSDTVFFISQVITGSEYCFVIEAAVNNDHISKSNRACRRTDIERPPQWINGDYATVSGNNLLLSFSYDTDTDIETFRIEMSTNPITGFIPIATLTTSAGKAEYNINPLPMIRSYYRLAALNSCGQPVVISNPVSLLIASLEDRSDQIYLEWNSYINWRGGVEGYTVYRRNSDLFREIATLGQADTSFTDNPYSFIYEITGDSVCYYIVAGEGSNPYFQGASSRSTTACMPSPAGVFVPTGFTPDDDGKNDLFIPVTSFTPVKYHLVIKSRSGTTLFESRDPFQAWDGKWRGSKLPQDVYLWFLEVETPGGRIITKHGTITIIFN